MLNSAPKPGNFSQYSAITQPPPEKTGMVKPTLARRLRWSIRQFPLVHAPLRWLVNHFRPAATSVTFGLLRKIIPANAPFGPPRGIYSDLELLSQTPSKLEGRIILRDQGNPKLPEPSIILLCKRTQHLQQPWPVFWTHHKNARLVGESLVHMNAARQLCIEAGYGRERTVRDPAYFHFATKSPPRLQGSWTSIISKWVPTDRPQPYAHWLLEALPRLALLEEFPNATGILVPPQKLRYQTESLDLLGLTNRCRGTPERDLVIEDYYFSAPPSMIVCYSPYAVTFLRSKFLPLNTNPPAAPKRFFVRRTTYGRNMVNEQAVLDFFQTLGWAIVDTGAIGFMEQIQLFQNAEAICAIHGSGTANMVWCSPGCKFIEMFAACYLAGDQEWIAQCVEVDYHFMIFPSDYKYDAHIDLNVLKEKLRSLKLL